MLYGGRSDHELRKAAQLVICPQVPLPSEFKT